MKKGARVDMGEHLAQYNHDVQELVKALRKVIIETYPSLDEIIRWNNLVYEKNGQICSIAVSENQVNLEFFHGAKLKDKENLLAGTGRLRYMKIKDLESIETTSNAITKMIKESLSFNSELSRYDICFIVILTFYLLSLFFLLVHFFLELWLHPMTTSAGVAQSTENVKVFWKISLSITEEIRLMLIAAIMGALGSYVHSAAAFITHTGNRDFDCSWVAWYLLLPFISSGMALIFYLAVRGMFFSFSASTEGLNAFGVAALGGIVGMFSKEATVKLRDLFQDLFNVTDESPWKKTQEREEKSLTEK